MSRCWWSGLLTNDVIYRYSSKTVTQHWPNYSNSMQSHIQCTVADLFELHCWNDFCMYIYSIIEFMWLSFEKSKWKTFLKHLFEKIKIISFKEFFNWIFPGHLFYNVWIFFLKTNLNGLNVYSNQDSSKTFDEIIDFHKYIVVETVSNGSCFFKDEDLS